MRSTSGVSTRVQLISHLPVTDALIDGDLLGRLSRQFGDVAETVSQRLGDSLIGRSGSHIVTRGGFCHV
ncbi:unnamed protein product [Sphagnum balticum]